MSTPISSRRAARYEDILALPDHVVGEIVDGELYVSPRPASPHTVAASILGMDVGGAYQRRAARWRRRVLFQLRVPGHI
jgi:hypothetical protein